MSETWILFQLLFFQVGNLVKILHGTKVNHVACFLALQRPTGDIWPGFLALAAILEDYHLPGNKAVQSWAMCARSQRSLKAMWAKGD